MAAGGTSEGCEGISDFTCSLINTQLHRGNLAVQDYSNVQFSVWVTGKLRGDTYVCVFSFIFAVHTIQNIL